jgi:hypothetical protein
MKKLFTTVAVAVISALTLNFISCEKNEDDVQKSTQPCIEITVECIKIDIKLMKGQDILDSTIGYLTVGDHCIERKKIDLYKPFTMYPTNTLTKIEVYNKEANFCTSFAFDSLTSNLCIRYNLKCK